MSRDTTPTVYDSPTVKLTGQEYIARSEEGASKVHPIVPFPQNRYNNSLTLPTHEGSQQ